MERNKSKENDILDTKNHTGVSDDLEMRAPFPLLFATSDLTAMRTLVEKVFGPIKND